MSGICLCLTAREIPAALEQAAAYRGYYDLAEMRVDLLCPDERKNLRDFPQKLWETVDEEIPLILTVRLEQDGGCWGVEGESEAERLDLMEELLERAKWSWVDVEYDRSMDRVRHAAANAGTRIISSFHDFSASALDKPVPELSAMMRVMAENDALPKMALQCTGSRQLLNLARLSLAVSDIQEKVLLGMGEWGIPSRILAAKFSSLWTYTSALEGMQAAPGQLDPQTLNTLYRYRQISHSTPVYAVVGNPVKHSRSPLLHNRWLAESGAQGSYIPMRCDDLSAAVETCDILGISGLSVTVPHKQQALSLCDYHDNLAGRIGAANTLLRAGDGWRARNTDASGFLESLKEGLARIGHRGIEGTKVLVIGAGGAARAVVFALKEAGADIVIVNRSLEKAAALAGEATCRYGPLSAESEGLLEGVDIAVQTTSVGMTPNSDADPVPWWNPHGTSFVFDMIYDPEKTLFLRRAEEAGVAIMNGSGMLHAQGVLQFKMFTEVSY